MALMTQTYKYDELMSIVMPLMPRRVEEALAPIICNIATYFIWREYAWPESISEITPFYLVASTQDYNSVPTDFAAFHKVQLRDTSTTPYYYYDPLDVLADLEYTETEGLPESICFIRGTNRIRVHPLPGAGLEASRFQIVGYYKKIPTAITRSTLQTLLPYGSPFHIGAWVQAAKYAAFTLADPQQAGQVTVQNGQRLFTGQAAVAKAAIDEMAADYNLVAGLPMIAPSEALYDMSGWY